MAPRKRICLTGETCSVGKVQEQTVMDRVNCTMVNSKFKEEKKDTYLHRLLLC